MMDSLDSFVVKEILLKAKKEVFSSAIGTHITPFKGEGIDFKEIKNYELGDDIRRINWKASAKNSEQILQVNLFNDEKELNIVFVFLLSGSINFGSKNLKQDIMAEVLAYLAYSAIKSSDSFMSIFFAESIKKSFKPTKKIKVLDEVISYAVKIDTFKMRVDYKRLDEELSKIKRKSLVFLIGDFLDEEIFLSNVANRHEIYALIIRDRLEESFDGISGELDLIDARNASVDRFLIDKGVKESYKKRIDEFDYRLNEYFLKYKIKSGKIYTDEDVFEKLLLILK